MPRIGVRRLGALVLGGVLVSSAAFAQAATEPCAGPTFCAGAASVDMTWHTGAGQGQYGTEGNGLTADRFDPFHHQTKMVPSHGMQSRLFAKAIVVRGADGTKAAYVKTELYLQQDVLTRRVAELVSGGDLVVRDYVVDGLDAAHVMLGATHNHSAPEYASTAFGIWLFTDTLDLRMFEATARRIAEAIRRADERLAPASVGAAVLRFRGVQRNILGPATADDGTPAGFPHDVFEDELVVIRFERAADRTPIAAWVNFGMHPESLDTTDFMSADFLGPTERIVERALGRVPGEADGPVVVWSQGAVGDIEPDQSRASPPAAGREYWHRDYAQMEKMSRDLAGAVLDAWQHVAAPDPEDARLVVAKHVPLRSDVPVAMLDRRFSGPLFHPLPTVSNCRTERLGIPVLGIPDCERLADPPEQFGTTLELLKDAGLPLPDNYGVPSYGAVQEELRIHVQALAIGDILVATVPGEPISDMVRNLKSRVDEAAGAMHLGYEWPCTDDGASVTCDFSTAAHQPPDPRPVDRAAYLRMLAEIRNPADGWEDDFASLQSESEPSDPAAIRGNFTHEEIQDLRCAGAPCAGYRLPILLGQANDYVGYIVTYREYMRGDHYRKALTAFGPHTADYVNTRLVRMAAELRGGPAVADAVLDPIVSPVDDALQTVKTLVAGNAGSALLAVSEAALPDDGGTAGTVVDSPTDIERFDAAKLSWIGGSNWTDNPAIVVQKDDSAGGWTTVATQEGGEIVLTLRYDSPFSAAPLDWLLGNKLYRWTATWEVFEETAPGSYRFVVDGHHRRGGAANAYRLESEPFTVAVWKGLVVHDLTAANGVASFAVRGVELGGGELETDDDFTLAPDEVHYPDTYEASGPYVRVGYETSGPHLYCYRCTFRPWANTGKVASVDVLVNGAPTTASFDGTRWSVSGLASGDVVEVPAGGVVDELGNTNGSAASLTIP